MDRSQKTAAWLLGIAILLFFVWLTWDKRQGRVYTIKESGFSVNLGWKNERVPLERGEHVRISSVEVRDNEPGKADADIALVELIDRPDHKTCWIPFIDLMPSK